MAMLGYDLVICRFTKPKKVGAIAIMNSSTLGPKDNLSTSSYLASSQRKRTLDISSLYLPVTPIMCITINGRQDIGSFDPHPF